MCRVLFDFYWACELFGAGTQRCDFGENGGLCDKRKLETQNNPEFCEGCGGEEKRKEWLPECILTVNGGGGGDFSVPNQTYWAALQKVGKDGGPMKTELLTLSNDIGYI